MMHIDSIYMPLAGGTDNSRGAFLAKFNCQGDLMWHKAFKCEQYDLHPNWLQIVEDTIYIMGNTRYTYPIIRIL